MDHKQKIIAVLKKQSLCVISTVSKENRPESALVGFAELPDLSLIFGTSTTSRKYINLLHNDSVAFSISSIGKNERVTIQYEGKIKKLEGNELAEGKKTFFLKNPHAKHYDLDPTQIFMKVIPRWIRYSDNTLVPNEIFEITI